MSYTGGYAALATSVAIYAVAAAMPAYAQEKAFNIPAQPAVTGIPELARQADVQILVSGSLVNGRTTRAVKGRMSVEQALRRLLAGTGLRVASNDGRTFTLSATAVTEARTDSPAQSAVTAVEDSDIVVTATRREQSLLDVPISIEAYNQESLDKRGVRNIEDLIRMTPGVTVETSIFNSKFVAIRGLTSVIGATMTGVYIDETPVQVRTLVLATNFYPAMFDLERVEVLRGPQGTLFGAGAMGEDQRAIGTPFVG